MNVTIKGKEYEFSFESVWGALYLYEEVCGDTLPYDPKKTLCLHVMWWCILARANKGFTLPLDEFLQALNDLELAAQLRDYYVQRMNVLTTSSQSTEPEDKKKV